MGLSKQLQEATEVMEGGDFAGIHFDSKQQVIDKVKKTFPDKEKFAALIREVQALEGKMKKHEKVVNNLMRKYPRDTAFLREHTRAVEELVISLLGVTVNWNRATGALKRAAEE